jgi:hypothetical protein
VRRKRGRPSNSGQDLALFGRIRRLLPPAGKLPNLNAAFIELQEILAADGILMTFEGIRSSYYRGRGVWEKHYGCRHKRYERLPQGVQAA